MRALMVPFMAVGVIICAHTNNPTENEMRSAFERSLGSEVADAMTLVRETGGREAIERVRAAGNDRFEIHDFRKDDCQPTRLTSGFDCTFAVNIILANGPMQRSLKGRFYNGPSGMQFDIAAQSSDTVSTFGDNSTVSVAALRD
jgi:hypothetical protein